MVNSMLPLVLTGACAVRKGMRLVGPVDLAIEAAGSLVIIGPNGSGKTTLLRMMHGLEPVRRGSRTWAVPEPEARARQGFVFQTPVMMRRSVLDNIAYPLVLRGSRPAKAREKARDWSSRMGLDGFLDQPADFLSGGERQKLALARALIGTPDILFLDEPCSNLDGQSTRAIEDMLLETRRSGTKIIMSTHDLGQARRLADTVLFLLHGKVHEIGPADDFFALPGTAEAASFLAGEILV